MREQGWGLLTAISNKGLRGTGVTDIHSLGS